MTFVAFGALRVKSRLNGNCCMQVLIKAPWELLYAGFNQGSMGTAVCRF